MDQYIFFKENCYLNLFNNDDTRLQICNQFRVKLLAISNTFGYIVVAFRNVVKILPVSQFETKTYSPNDKFSQDFDTVGVITYAPEQEVVYVQLNCNETHLIVLTCQPIENGSNFEFCLNVYDLQSLSFSSPLNQQQTPYLVNAINLKKDSHFITDLTVSHVEPDELLLCKSNGEVILITKLLDKNFEMISKMSEATAVCWSIKGKTVIACASQNRVFTYNHQDLKQKNCYNCPNKSLIATYCKSVSAKRFEIGYDLVDGDKIEPVFSFTDLSVDKNTNKENVSQTLYQSDFVYAMDTDYVPKMSAFYTHLINEWNLFLCAFTKCPDLCHLIKQQDVFNILDLENYRCSLPLNTNDEEMFPLGLIVSYNMRKQIEFETQLQPPSPLVLILTDTGILGTFFAVNRQSNQSICYDAKAIPFRTYSKKEAQQVQQTSLKPVQSQSSGGLFSFSSNLGTQPTSSLFGQPPSQISLTAPKESQSTFSFGSLVNQPPTTPLSAPLTTPSISFKPPQQQQQQQQQTIQFKQSVSTTQIQHSVSTTQIQQQPARPQIQQQPIQSQMPLLNQQLSQPSPSKPIPSLVLQQPQQQQMQMQQTLTVKTEPPKVQFQSKSIKDEMNLRDRINQFTSELDDFKQNVNKLFSGKDLTKCLLNLSVIKDTKMSEEKLAKLKEETKQLSEETSSLMNKILTGFHDYENYKLQVKKSTMTKSSSLVNYDLDPHWKTKFENIKKMYYYLQNELPNMDDYVYEASKKRKDRISNTKPLHEVYETIRLNNITVKILDNQLNKIIDQLKYAKLGRAIFKDISLNLISTNSRLNVSNKPEVSRLMASTDDGYNDENSYKTANASLTQDRSRFEDSDLINQIGQIRLRDDSNLDIEEKREQIKQNSERNAKYNNKLYNLLKRRAKVPVHEINLEKIKFLDVKFDEAKSTQININEASFLNLKTQQSPLPASKTAQFIQQPQPAPLLPVTQQPIPQLVFQTTTAQPLLTQPPPQVKPTLPQPLPPQQQQQQQQFSFGSTQPPSKPSIQVTESPKQQQPQPTALASAFQQPKPQQQVQSASPQTQPQTPKQTIPTSSSQQQFSFGGSTGNFAFGTPKQTTEPPKAQPAPSTSNASQPTGLFSNLSGENKLFPKSSTPLSNTQLPAGTLTGESSSTATTTTTAPKTSLFGNLPQSNSLFSFGESKQSTQQQPLATNLFKNEPLTPQKPGELVKPELKQQQETSKPVDNLIKQNLAPVESQNKPNELNKTITISTNNTNEANTIKPLPTAASAPAISTQFKLADAIKKEASQAPAPLTTTDNKTKTELATAVTSSPKPTPTLSIPSSSSNLSTALSSGTTTPSAFGGGGVSQPATPFSFSFGAQPSSNSNQIKASFSFGSQSSLPPSSQQSTSTTTTAPTTPIPASTNTNIAATSATSTPTSSTGVLPTANADKTITPAQTETTTTVASSESTASTQPAQTNTQTPTASATTNAASTPNGTILFSTASIQNKPATTTGSGFFGANVPPATSTPTHSNTAPSQVTGTSLFSGFMPNQNLFSAVAAQSTPQKPPTSSNQAEIDADMESATNGTSASFGNLGFGTAASKPADQNKNIFGGSGSLFGSSTSQQQQQSQTTQPKSPFGSSSGASGAILKTATFTFGQGGAQQPQQPQANLFGSTNANAGVSNPSGSLFGSSATNSSNQQSGGLFSSFKTPQKTSGAFGAPPAFGAAPAFGATSTFGGTSSGFGGNTVFGSPPVFGSGANSTGPTTSGTFGSSAGGSLFGSSSNSTTTGFGALAAASGGNTFGSFGGNTNSIGFGALAQQGQQQQQQQQQPQTSLFSSFGGGQTQSGFGNPAGSSFTTYRK